MDDPTRPATRAAYREYQMVQVMAAGPFPAAVMEALTFHVVAELEYDGPVPREPFAELDGHAMPRRSSSVRSPIGVRR